MRLALALVLAASPAAANPITLGANVGLSQTKTDSNGDANRTLGVFARLGLGARVAGQLELAQIESQTSATDDIKQGGAFLLADFAGGAVVPLVLIGGGIDRESWGFGDATYARAEAGLGLELRTAGGFVLGADVRLGTRTVLMQSKSDVLANMGPSQIALLTPETLHEGEYRSARVTLGVTF
jgi:hypothetical protein